MGETSQRSDGISSDSPDQPFNEELLKIIACPVTKKPLRYDKATNALISDEIEKAYPIVNGIPNLLPENALPLKER
ncbi:protein preY, putative [Ixodes scapularis]|uniref:Protein preY, mitochondrial n=1 Tax=Ixodes scapularis TaxID=6945 RepID=B7PCD5_IXOSC|nr:protein preY, putative [Ixodes scapularis]|eukprot:XP_002409676.1 protein preY, putative [Ixodes scapularis]